MRRIITTLIDRIVVLAFDITTLMVIFAAWFAIWLAGDLIGRLLQSSPFASLFASLLFFPLPGWWIVALVASVLVPMAIVYAARRMVWRIGNACPRLRGVCYVITKER